MFKVIYTATNGNESSIKTTFDTEKEAEEVAKQCDKQVIENVGYLTGKHSVKKL